MRIWTAAAAALGSAIVFGGCAASAQPVPPSPPGAALPLPTPMAPPPPPPPPPDQAYAAQAQPVAAGRVTQLLTNPNGDVDGFLMEDGTQVQFPPHLSAALLRIVRPGDAVSVQGFRGYQVPVVRATTITDSITRRSIVDEPPNPAVAPPPPPGALSALSAQGAIARLLYTDRGDLSGVLLADHSIVHFPPPVGVQLQGRLSPGKQVSASGYGTENPIGRSLEATSISIDGQAAIALYGPPGGAPGAPLPPR